MFTYMHTTVKVTLPHDMMRLDYFWRCISVYVSTVTVKEESIDCALILVQRP